MGEKAISQIAEILAKVVISARAATTRHEQAARQAQIAANAVSLAGSLNPSQRSLLAELAAHPSAPDWLRALAPSTSQEVPDNDPTK